VFVDTVDEVVEQALEPEKPVGRVRLAHAG
jgi:hypothetical protein